jgi:uncharacterized protein (TIGR03435 family)
MRSGVTISIVSALVATAPCVRGQSADQKPLAFEVATVKQHNSDEQGPFIRLQPGGRVTVANMSVHDLITYAYQLAVNQLVGGPFWIASDHFDVIAKLEDNPQLGTQGSGPNAIQLSMRTLLNERFGLKMHHEPRELDIYALVMVKQGVTGPALKTISATCAAAIKAGPGTSSRSPNPPTATSTAPCGGIGIGPGVIRFGGFPLSQLTSLLGDRTGRVVLDRTGLRGRWQFELRFAPEQLGQPPGAEASTPDPDAPSIFTAIQEQLGLKLESTKAAVDVLVIDHVERPTLD